jgi:hypothetical protein
MSSYPLWAHVLVFNPLLTVSFVLVWVVLGFVCGWAARGRS